MCAMHAERRCSVLVVGAGMAGLSAAKELSKHFHDVLVVEATDRTGGRIKQVTLPCTSMQEIGINAQCAGCIIDDRNTQGNDIVLSE